MSNSEIINTIINGFTAVGTIVVAILAIWGDVIRAKFAGPKLSLLSHNLRGSVVPQLNGSRAIFYYLIVVNSRSWARAKNCRVVLQKIWRKLPNGAFREVPLTTPATFAWSPSETTPPYITLVKEQILAFGIVIEGQDHFRPVLLFILENFQGFVRANEIVRFGLEIVSDDFVSSHLQVFEVAWNGHWNDNLDVMAQNLQIQEVTNQVKET